MISFTFNQRREIYVLCYPRGQPGLETTWYGLRSETRSIEELWWLKVLFDIFFTGRLVTKVSCQLIGVAWDHCVAESIATKPLFPTRTQSLRGVFARTTRQDHQALPEQSLVLPALHGDEPDPRGLATRVPKEELHSDTNPIWIEYPLARFGEYLVRWNQDPGCFRAAASKYWR